jgi:hypothetical protein
VVELLQTKKIESALKWTCMFNSSEWEDKAMGQGATLNAVEDYWPWPGRSPMVGPPLFVMIK